MSTTKLAAAVRTALIAGGAMAMTGMPAAHAQQGAPATTDTSGQIEEIIVTAERRESSLQDTPIAISALSADLLTDRGVTDFSGVAKSSPSMSFTPYPSSNNTLILYMRGQGASDAAQITLDSAVGLYQDGFYLSRGQAVTFDLADIERVEVLRGPQGTLYGRNTTGGAVNMISKKPTGELHFKQELGFGSENRLRSLSVLDLPKVGGLSSKISFLKRDQDGYVKNMGAGRDFGEEGQTAGRVALRWDNGSPLTADFFYELGEMTGTPGYYVNDVWSGDNPNLLPFVPPIPGYTSDGKPEDETWRPIDLKESKADFQSMGLTLTWDVNDALTLKSLTGYRDVKSIFYQDYADSFLAGFRTFDDVRFHQFSQELQALGSLFDDRLDYLIGLYYFKEGASHFENVQITTDIGGVPSNFLLDKDRDVHADAESKAIFAQLTWTPAILDDRLDLTIGGRYTKDTRDASRTLQNSLLNPATPSVPATQFCDFVTVFQPCIIGLEPTGDPSQITSNSVESSKFNPAFTANYRWTDDVSTYLRIATGYKAGGSAESGDVGQFGGTFDPEDVTLYELGLKSYLFDRRVRLNLAVFDSEYEDMQLFFNTNPQDLSVLVATNAGKASVKGVELETLWQPTDTLRFTFDYTYLDASYDEVAAPANTIFDPAVNPDSPYQVGDNVKDVFAMPYAPENSYNVGADWTFAEFNTSKLALILNYRWEDKTFLSAPAGPAIPGRDFYARDSYGLLDARVSWNIDFANDSHGRMDVYMNNVLDDEWESHLIAFGNAIPVAGQPAGYSNNAIIWAERPIYGVNFIYEF
jgi:iron complex outermembrane receptor protein